MTLVAEYSTMSGGGGTIPAGGPISTQLIRTRNMSHKLIAKDVFTRLNRSSQFNLASRCN